MSNLIIDLDRVSKKFKKTMALSNLSLQIRSGEIFGLIGPDGAGKSTLTHIIAGISSPDGGRVAVLGKIGFLPQGLGLALAQELSVEENIDYFAEINEVERQKREARKAVLLKKTGLEAFRGRPAKHLSGGMQQKLALCCTLIYEPKLLLLDEPTTGVDPISRRDLWSLLNGLVEESGATILLTTSYMDEAARCHRVALMHQGKILALGEPGELLAKEGATEMEALFLAHISSQDDAINRQAFEEFFHKTAPPEHNGKKVIISADQLEKKFGGFTAVNKINFDIKQGEIFGFLGPNGAGKTTTIKMLCGLLRPTFGTGTVAGFDLSRQSGEVKKNIGYMSQRFSLYGSLTVAENIELYGSVYEVERQELLKRRKLIFQIADLVGRENAITRDLPLGLKQRLALGCAIIHKPACVFLDEPTSGVDPLARKKFWDTIHLLSRQMGVTILVSTHHLDEARRCDRIILINQGNIVAAGSEEELRKQVQGEKGTLLEVLTDDLSLAFKMLKQSFPFCVEYGAHVHVYTKDLEADKQKIQKILASGAVELKSLQEQVVPFEAVFAHFCETAKEPG